MRRNPLSSISLLDSVALCLCNEKPASFVEDEPLCKWGSRACVYDVDDDEDDGDDGTVHHLTLKLCECWNNPITVSISHVSSHSMVMDLAG